MSTTLASSLMFVTLLIFCSHPILAANDNGNIITTRIKLTANDTIIEFYNNCSCTPDYLCQQVNQHIIAAQANELPQEIKCSDPFYVCCKKPSIPTETTTPPTSSETSKPTSSSTTTNSTTETPETRRIVTDLSCGAPKTQVNVRILTPETESATTIPGEVPWIVEIFQKPKSPQFPNKFKCAGTLIHPKVVLTATHCIVSAKANALKIVATGQESFQNLGVQPDDERNVVKIIKHPGYYSGGLYNDIALLILDTQYNFSSQFLNSICLPNANQNFTGRKCVAVGWGANPNLSDIPLRKVDVPIVDFQRCQELLRKTHLGPEFNLHSSFICAGGEEGKDTCKGDGGSPLVCFGDEYKYVQIGIVSWGVDNKCGIVDQPGLYTDVIKFKDWITKTLSDNKIEIKVKPN